MLMILWVRDYASIRLNTMIKLLGKKYNVMQGFFSCLFFFIGSFKTLRNWSAVFPYTEQ